MPNDCSNHVTITSTYDRDILSILQEINKEFPNVVVKQQTLFGLRLHFITAWKPPISFTEALIDKYPLAWIKQEWISEDGSSGIWIGKKNDFKSWEWEDLSIDAAHFFFS